MLQSPIIGRLLFGGAILTVLLVPAHGFLPSKTWHWVPGDNLPFFVYADDVFGGNSYAERVSPDKIHFRCQLAESDIGHPPFCGFHVYLPDGQDGPGADLSGYQKMIVDFDYIGGNEKLRFYIREFEPGFSDPENPLDTSKYMSVYIPDQNLEQPVEIGLNEFTVADWWVNNHDVPRAHALASTSRVVAFGADIAYPSAMGEHELLLNRVTFEGHWVSAERWYLGILLSWAGIVLGAGVVTLYQYHSLTWRLAKEKDQYRDLAKIDALTGLMNRRGLDEEFGEEVRKRLGDIPVSLMYIDIDHFKPLNDTYGHHLGDEVLKRVAHCIGEHSRQADKAVRWGGEEFLLVMPGTLLAEARLAAERLRKAVEKLVHPELDSQSVTVSIGLGEMGLEDTLEQALERADQALYRAKEAGRNRVIQQAM